MPDQIAVTPSPSIPLVTDGLAGIEAAAGSGTAGGLLGEDEARRGQAVSIVQQPDADLVALVAGDQAGLLAGQDGAVVFELGGRGGGGDPGENVLDGGPVDGVIDVACRVDVGGPQRPVLAGLRTRRPGM